MNDLAIEGSNSLADLAARIRQEHEEIGAALKRGLDHAINAGQLLLEAKAQLKHGQWLPWLTDHCQVPERSAQRYMLLARHAPELVAKSDNLADLTMTGALDLLAPPADAAPDLDDWDSFSEWAQHQLDAPFNAWDFPDDEDECETNYHWIQTKLRHQIGLPWTVDWCFSVCDATEDGHPPLRLCPWDDLEQAAKLLGPIAGSDEPKQSLKLKFDLPDMQAMQGAIAVVHIDAMWMLGNVLNEIEYRLSKHFSDEDYEKEWEETHSAVMARIEAQLAEVRSTV